MNPHDRDDRDRRDDDDRGRDDRDYNDRRRDRDDYDDRPRRRRSRDDDYDDRRPPRRKRNTVLIVVLIFVGLAVIGVPAILLISVQKVREAAVRSKLQNNLKQFAIAMHNHDSANSHLPPAAICDKNGKPLLSWRVAILPYIEQAQLYQQFNLNEPWDGPNNKRLIELMPKIYAPLDNPDVANAHKTYYRVFHGKGAGFEGNIGIAMDSLRDTSETIMIVEAGEPVIWTKPEELEYDDSKPLPPLGGMLPNNDYYRALMFDGSVRNFKRDESEATLRAAIRRRGGKVDK
jgi:Protein of unknown function (DUF1559)